MTRDIKKFARSRPSWEDQILSGFGITKLVTERYRANAAREDRVGARSRASRLPPIPPATVARNALAALFDKGINVALFFSDRIVMRIL